MNLKNYVDGIAQIFHEKGKPEIAFHQAKYMKNHFQFYGLKVQEWTGLSKIYFIKHGYPPIDELDEFVKMCYSYPQREMHYFAITVLEKLGKNLPASAIDIYEYAITNQSWWDSVDRIAKLVGQHLTLHPELQPSTTDRFNESDHLWLIRVSIIFQLFYRYNTDIKLLEKYMLPCLRHKDFFIRKAIGWALRQYGRYNPEFVVNFVEQHQREMSGLSIREAIRNL